MAAQTPMGADASLTIEEWPGDLLSVTYNDGNGNVQRIAVQSADALQDNFRWLVTSAAAFHNIPVIDTTS